MHSDKNSFAERKKVYYLLPRMFRSALKSLSAALFNDKASAFRNSISVIPASIGPEKIPQLLDLLNFTQKTDLF